MTKRIISLVSLILIIICIVVGIKKGLFNDLLEELQKSKVESKNLEVDNSENINESNTIALEKSINPTKTATYDKTLFYDIGQDIYYAYPPSLQKGEFIVNITNAYISKDLNDFTKQYLNNPQYLTDSLKNFPEEHYFVSVIVKITNVGTTHSSWSMGSSNITSFNPDEQVNIYNISIPISDNYGKISGDGDDFDIHGESYLDPGETLVCKLTGIVPQKLIDNVKNNNEKLYFIPSTMYLKTPQKQNALAFVKLDFDELH